MTTFTPPIVPSVSGTTQAKTPRVRRADFGDGYSQRGRDGLNYVKRTVTLTWESLSAADAATLDTFFDGVAGADAFAYTLPLESTEYKWTNGAVKKTYLGGERVTLSVDLTQEFDL